MSSPQKTSPPFSADDLPEIVTPNAKLGMILFVIYSAIYAGFIGWATFSLETLASPSPLGVNWGLLYGLALILGAFLLAMLYMVLCRNENAEAKEGRKI